VVNALQTALVHQVAENGGKAVTQAYDAKIKKYKERCSKEGLEFVAMAADTFGGWHPAALQILSKLGRQLGRVTGREEEETVRHLRQQLAVVLVRDNMNRMLSRAPALPGSEITGQI
jgi:hypothetical protein